MDYAEFLKKASEIHGFLEDDISKNVFLQRVLYNISGSNACLHDMLQYTSERVKSNAHVKYYGFMNVTKGETIVIYGAGYYGRFILEDVKHKFSQVDIIYCDRNHDSIAEIEGCSIISPEIFFSKYKKCKVIIATFKYFDEVYEYLSKYSNVENLYSLKLIYDENCYFPTDIITLAKDEIFVDGGAYDGKTSAYFAKWCDNKYKKIHLFEPDEGIFCEMTKNVEQLKNIEVHSCGLWDEDTTLHFDIIEGGSSCVVENNGDIQVPVNSIDNVCKNDSVTFIKLDVEGAELKALMGAKDTIQNCKPKLAVCLYHKAEDILEIPLYIKQLLPEYKMYIRHHSTSRLDTVLYAIYPRREAVYG